MEELKEFFKDHVEVLEMCFEEMGTTARDWVEGGCEYEPYDLGGS